jgi:AAA15 family ATPase/GTPase
MTTPIIENLQINRFRGIRDLNLAGLGWVNILVGKNNSGKTTILEAISIACNPKYS